MVVLDLIGLGEFYMQTHSWYAEWCRMLDAELQKTDLAQTVRDRFQNELARASKVRDRYEQSMRLCDAYIKNAAPRAGSPRVA